jgi:hypothetical protein
VKTAAIRNGWSPIRLIDITVCLLAHFVAFTHPFLCRYEYADDVHVQMYTRELAKKFSKVSPKRIEVQEAYVILSHASTRSAWTKGAPSSRGPSKRPGDELRRARAAAAVGSGGGGGAPRGTAPAARHDPGHPISVILATASRVPGHGLPPMDEEYGPPYMPPRWGVSTTDYECAIPSYAKALGLELAPPD